MKTFLISIPQRLKLKSNELDAQATLCNKAWTIFNDEGVKQLFIFRSNGSLLVSTNGVVTNSTWEYIPANNSIILTTEGRSIMFHPAFIDDVVFALQQDGVESALFMIDENNKQFFFPETLSELAGYFAAKEAILLEEEIKKKEEAARIEENRALAASNKQIAARLREQYRETIKEEYANEIEAFRLEAIKNKKYKKFGVFSIALIVIIMLVILPGNFETDTKTAAFCVAGILSLLSVVFFALSSQANSVEDIINSFIDVKLKEKFPD